MISREDFIFTIGYDGGTAIVDGKSKRKYSRLSTEELARKGLFKPALCSALYAKDEKGLQLVCELYNARSDKKIVSIDHLKRTLGVSEIPEEINKVMVC
jgi:hypothetical protein